MQMGQKQAVHALPPTLWILDAMAALTTAVLTVLAWWLLISSSSSVSSSTVRIRCLMLASSCTFALPTHPGSSGKTVLTTNLKNKMTCSIATAAAHSRWLPSRSGRPDA